MAINYNHIVACQDMVRYLCAHMQWGCNGASNAEQWATPVRPRSTVQKCGGETGSGLIVAGIGRGLCRADPFRLLYFSLLVMLSVESVEKA